MLEAAVPVLAVTEMIPGFFAYFFLSDTIIAFKSKRHGQYSRDRSKCICAQWYLPSQ